ncbi:MAG: triacylglycerol lipase [Methyloprofundus sp.]|nr:MAG: triacylglycerol lipase [Methyloprofundus sp.]
MNKRKFNPSAKGFSKLNLAYLAFCSNLAYESKEKIRLNMESQGFNLERDNYFFSDSVTGTQCFIVGDNKKIIITFRGTEGKVADWVTDIQLFKDTWTNSTPIGQVHKGFYKALQAVFLNIENEINTLRTNNQTIWVTGHSLGGALATLAAATLKFQGSEIHFNGLYTFGQPRLGDRMFANAFNKYLKQKCFRVVNNNDVVSRVPPQIFGYSHVGTLKYFDVNGKLHSDSSLSWWAKFWDRLEGRYDNGFDIIPDDISDHSMDIYQSLSEHT